MAATQELFYKASRCGAARSTGGADIVLPCFIVVALLLPATATTALELAGELSAAPGYGGKPLHEWLELCPFLAAPMTITE